MSNLRNTSRFPLRTNQQKAPYEKISRFFFSSNIYY